MPTPPHLKPTGHRETNTQERERKTERETMENSSPETESPTFSIPKRKPKTKPSRRRAPPPPPPPPPRAAREKAPWPKKKLGGVMLEAYIEGSETGSTDDGSSIVGRTKSLTDEDLEELKGCLDLGFGFSYDEIPELCNTLPALELCYSMSQRFLDEQHQRSPDGEAPERTPSSAPASPIANWRISSPGDDPDEVKARLKYWAQAVACTVRLCS